MVSLKLIAFNSLVLFASLMSSGAQAECGEISISEMSWASSQIVTSVSVLLLEQGYGCTVKIIPTSPGLALTSLAEYGEPNIVTEFWLNLPPLYYKLESEGAVIAASRVLSDRAQKGWWIPQNLAAKCLSLKMPDPIMGNIEMIAVEISDFEECAQNCNYCKEDPAAITHALTLVTNDLAKREPDVLALMKRVNFTYAQIDKLLMWQEQNKAFPYETARYFLSTQHDVWSRWVNEKAYAELTAFLQEM